MTDKDSQLTDVQLDELFASARTDDPVPQEDFMARLFADIDSEAAAQVTAQTTAPIEPRRSVLASLWAALGGWAGAGGLVAAATTGIWIGVADPSSLSTITDLIWGDSLSVSVLAPEDILGLES